ncbi:hypothetical protein VTO42DRAFT_500 [Malbranchea cinnamomea]
MSLIIFSIVDVFSTIAYKGNPLAVVSDLSAALTDSQMRLIDRQFNLSETTCVNPSTVANAACRLRSFLLDEEGGVWGRSQQSRCVVVAGEARISGFDPTRTAEQRRNEDVGFNQQLGQEALLVTAVMDGDGLSITLRQEAPRFYGVHDKIRT